MTGTSKLPATVLRRTAVVYVRQSTMAQVQHNLESQRRQYGLVDLARGYGFNDVIVIDDDLGKSGSGVEERPGFERLVGLLCAGTVGAVFCLEASRLARNGHDWHRLLELCGLVGAAVIDGDGAYDPRRPNDRLLLGMKGTISEFELGILRSRLNEALWAKARRGELRIPVPHGYVWWPHPQVSFDPDIRMQESIRLIFSKFRELGSARQVLGWMCQEGLHLPRPVDGKQTTSFEWVQPRYRGVISVLKNPFYAGVYAYGKSSNRTDMVGGRPRKSYGHTKPIEEWDVVIRDHHEGYISWEEYQHNQELLARNAYSKREGSSKSGRGGGALLAGLLRCRRCGMRLHVYYSSREGQARPARASRYLCRRDQIAYGQGKCLCFGGWVAERAIGGEIVRVLQPLALEAAMAAEQQFEQQQQERRRSQELELVRARYEAQLAERRYAACDPENRLVATQLEASWEESMRRVRAFEERLDVVGPRPVRAPVVGEFDDLAADLSLAWDAPMTTPRIRQRLVRALIEEIVVDIDEHAREVVLIIHWKGGQHSEVRVRKLKTGETQRKTEDDVVQIIQQMSGRWSDDKIAATLNRMGKQTGEGKTWNATRVYSCRTKRGIRAYKSADKSGAWLTMSEAAAELGVTNHAIRRLIKIGALPAEQVVARAPYQIRAEDLHSEGVKSALVSRGGPCRVESELQMSLFTRS